MLSLEKNEIFNIASLNINFKTKIDVNHILREIEKKYSLNEITKFCLVAFYRKKIMLFYWPWQMKKFSFDQIKIYL